MHYPAHQVESKWRTWWETKKLYRAPDRVKGKKNFYHLVMFPYPSGDLHIGHWFNFAPADIWARWKRRSGKFNVLSPIGFDAFGLPAENAAIKGKLHPRVWTMQNIERMREQLKSMGAIYDWSREVVTCDPEYYRWNQWIFLQLFKHGLAYRAPVAANWCPQCKTVLANEQVVDGACERCHAPVVQKNVTQWLFKITAYTERLLKDLDGLDWPEQTKAMQRNWIGKSEGAIIAFPIAKFGSVIAGPSAWLGVNSARQSRNQQEIAARPSGARNDEHSIEVFTTRADTLFGATYIVLAPEHPFVGSVETAAKRKAVQRYLAAARRKTELERLAETKEKTGVFTGAYAINPVSGRKIPIWVSDYVLASYGTGAIMAVPAHDARDFAFAKAMKLPVVEVISPDAKPHRRVSRAYTDDGILVRSGAFSGMSSADGRRHIVASLAQEGLAKVTVQYRLRDWIISRQRYWGTPIPLVFCEACKKRAENIKNDAARHPEGATRPKDLEGLPRDPSLALRMTLSKGEMENPGWVSVPDKELPVLLPDIKEFKPTGTGQSPLARLKEFVSAKCPKCGGPAKRETDTMDTFVDSSWYYVRYADSHNNKRFADPEKVAAWLPVNMYIGGAEHSVLHLLYSRFFTKALFDLGHLKFQEPFRALRHQGFVLGEDNYKMSKSRGNVVSPDELVRRYGTDVMRLYLAFMGDWSKGGPWSSKGIEGMARFVRRLWDFFAQTKFSERELSAELRRLEHETVKKVGADIAGFQFNTAVSSLMVFFSRLQIEPAREAVKVFVQLLAPFAPHLAEELWQVVLKEKGSVHESPWPKYSKRTLQTGTVTIVVQVDGKVRERLTLPAGATERQALEAAWQSPKVVRYVTPETLKKSVFVPKRLLSLVRKQS
ncbi:leucine--tRNA ligase [Candidatus Parcubacteria bacterium]|nr:leucine--tRNA ligase [Candidatus Parcubacteria bacterium]